MNSTTGDDLFGPIVTATVRLQRAAAVRAAGVLKARLGKPVQRIGGRVIRSKPGEPARRDTGALQASIDSEAIARGDAVEAVISTDRYYAPILEGPRFRRLVMTDLKNRFAEDMARAGAEAFKGV